MPAKSNGKIVIRLNLIPNKNGTTNCLAKIRAEKGTNELKQNRKNKIIGSISEITMKNILNRYLLMVLPLNIYHLDLCVDL